MRLEEDKYICSAQAFLFPQPECFPSPAPSSFPKRRMCETPSATSHNYSFLKCHRGPDPTQTCLTADSPSGCICCVKPDEPFNLYYVQMPLSLHPAMILPLPALGCHNRGFLQCSPSSRAVLRSPASVEANSQVMVLWRVLS